MCLLLKLFFYRALQTSRIWSEDPAGGAQTSTEQAMEFSPVGTEQGRSVQITANLLCRRENHALIHEIRSFAAITFQAATASKA
jgi:hypothetical protein